MTAAPEISVVVLTWNTRELTLACLRALARDAARHTREIIVVDNASNDGTAKAVEDEFADVRVVRSPENVLYAAGNNLGVEHASGRFVCLLNSDTEVKTGAIDRLRDFLASNEAYGATCPKLLHFDGTVQRACTRFPSFIDAPIDSFNLERIGPFRRIYDHTRMAEFDHLESRDVEQPPGAVFMMRREEFLRFGGFDPLLSLYFNDVDLCLKLHKAGRRVRFVAEAEVFHHQGASTKRSVHVQQLWASNRRAYYRKNHGWLVAWGVRAVMWTWTVNQAARILLGPRPFAHKRVAWKDLGQSVRGAL